VVVRPNLSKARHRYLTFLGEEGCGYLAEYLRGRAELGEALEPDSDVIHPEAGPGTPRGSHPFLRTIKVSEGVRLALRQGGFRWRPYVLRAYFDTQLLLAESKGKVAHDYRVFWMGHKGSMEARYTTNKGRLPETLIDDMREAYHRCESFLSTTRTVDRDDVRHEVTQVLLDSLGYSEKDLEGVDLSAVKQVRALIQQRVAPASKNQALVSLEELPKLLEAGWTFVGSIGADRVLLNPPQLGGLTPLNPSAPSPTVG
jgi:hypothetical protein